MDPTEIYNAAVFGDYELVDKLLSSNPALVNAKDKYGFTPLHGVVGEHHFKMAEYLIAKGADVTAKNDSGITPLHLAAYPEMVEILVGHGADLEAKDDGGGTPLHIALESPDSLDVVQKMLELGAKVNATDNGGQTALDTAIARGETEQIALLREYGGVQSDDAR